MAYDARAIANYFLDLAKQKGVPLTPMKLQKLIYFAHGWRLGLNNEALIVDPIQAWQYGPVISSVYQEFKHFGSGAITSNASSFDFDKLEFVTPEVKLEDKETRALLNRIWDVYGKYSAMKLSNLSHIPNGPWDKARKKSSVQNVVIDDELIGEYFRSLVAKNKAEVA
ncbi:Panacea domain-containing protein [Undibacterium sp. RuTC16W]|uniref:Panacea domain-containing protein n=1 Tax=Undibacterium sp. RuTC16W TaxID=3413048 RepID=UPI003BF2C385